MTAIVQQSGDSGIAGSPMPISALGVRSDRRRQAVPPFAVKIAAGWLALVVLTAIFADILPVPKPTAIIGMASRPPFTGFPEFLGTDELGRSEISRLIYGSRVSLIVGFGGSAIGAVLGGLLGLAAGFFRGVVELVIDAICAALLAFPALLMIMAIVAVVRPTTSLLAVCLGLLGVAPFARVMKSNTIALRDREFVLAARALGATTGRTLLREILPNALVPMFAMFAVSVAVLITAEGGLSFVGLSVPPPTPTWGAMIAAGNDQIAQAPWITITPCVAMFLTIYSFNVLGDYVRSRLDIGEGRL